jgi:hypothetical protein
MRALLANLPPVVGVAMSEWRVIVISGAAPPLQREFHTYF